MACVAPKEEWTIAMISDSATNASEQRIVVFCVDVNDGIITGEVTEVVNGEAKLLSAVTGTHELLPGTNIAFRTFNFTSGSSRVMLAGNASLSSTPREFVGRYAAFASAQVAASAGGGSTAPQFAPGDGDTGTGTGTQT
jgi:hypothetical protein